MGPYLGPMGSHEQVIHDVLNGLNDCVVKRVRMLWQSYCGGPGA